MMEVWVHGFIVLFKKKLWYSKKFFLRKKKLRVQPRQQIRADAKYRSDHVKKYHTCMIIIFIWLGVGFDL